MCWRSRIGRFTTASWQRTTGLHRRDTKIGYELMDAHEEIELKLRIDPDSVARLRQSDWWRKLGGANRKRLRSVYFDTSDRRLRRLDISLRTRTDGRDTIQTVKMASKGTGSVARREWETLVPDAIPDPSLVIDPALPQEFRKLTAPDLQPLFDVDVKRDTRRLDADQAQIELSLDEGAVTSGEQRQDVREVELELVSGDLEQLFAEARRLSDISGGRLHARTKSDVGYALVRGTRKHWSQAPALELDAEMTAGDALRAIARNCFEHLTANDDCARLNLDPEGVHQCRVALRRLRSLFKTYESMLRGRRVEPLDTEVRWLGNVLGSARDLDVLRTDLLEPAISALGETDQLAPLISGLEDNRARAYSAVHEALSSSRYRHFLVDLCAFGYGNYHDLAKSKLGPEALDQPLRQFAAAALAKTHRKLLKRGRDFETLSQNERHSVRIALKKLRYAVDFFGGVFDPERRTKFFKSLARLQEDLGSMNDVAVAEARLARLVGVSADDGSDLVAASALSGKLTFAAGCVLGWHRRRAAEIDEHLVKDWHAFARAKPFWQGELAGE
jgi:triphosphatase